MITYVVWPKTIDAEFRAFYPTASGGEIVEALPQKLDANQDLIEWPNTTEATYYKLGSSRLTAQGAMALVVEFGDDVTFLEGDGNGT